MTRNSGTQSNSASINGRIELIGQLSEEHRRCVTTGDRPGLLVLAYRYETECKHMSQTARAIKWQAAEMELK